MRCLDELTPRPRVWLGCFPGTKILGRQEERRAGIRWEAILTRLRSVPFSCVPAFLNNNPGRLPPTVRRSRNRGKAAGHERTTLADRRTANVQETPHDRRLVLQTMNNVPPTQRYGNQRFQDVILGPGFRDLHFYSQDGQHRGIWTCVAVNPRSHSPPLNPGRIIAGYSRIVSTRCGSSSVAHLSL